METSERTTEQIVAELRDLMKNTGVNVDNITSRLAELPPIVHEQLQTQLENKAHQAIEADQELSQAEQSVLQWLQENSQAASPDLIPEETTDPQFIGKPLPAVESEWLTQEEIGLTEETPAETVSAQDEEQSAKKNIFQRLYDGFMKFGKLQINRLPNAVDSLLKGWRQRTEKRRAERAQRVQQQPEGRRNPFSLVENENSLEERLAKKVQAIVEKLNKAAAGLDSEDEESRYLDLVQKVTQDHAAVVAKRSEYKAETDPEKKKQLSDEVYQLEKDLEQTIELTESRLQELQGPGFVQRGRERISQFVGSLETQFTAAGRREAKVARKEKQLETTNKRSEKHAGQAEALLAEYTSLTDTVRERQTSIARIKARLEANIPADERAVRESQLKQLEAEVSPLEKRLKEMKKKYHEALEKQRVADVQANILQIDVQIARLKQVLDQVRFGKFDETAIEVSRIQQKIAALEARRAELLKKEPDNATETERSSLLNSVGRAFAENGVLRNVWEITGGKIKSREQALWLLAMIIAGLAGGAPALMAASTGALVRGIQRAGLLDLDVSSQEIYAKFAGMSPEEIYAEISEGLSEDAEETSNETPEGARRNYLKSLLRIPGGVFGIIGNALNTADRKILGVINNGAETRGVQYAREIAEALQQSSDYDGALAKYVDQSIGREELDRLIKEVRRAENEQAKEVAVKALRKKLNQMRRLVEDIAQLQAQGGVIVGGAAMGLRTAELSVGERSALSPQNLLNLRRNLEKAVDRIRQFLSYDNQEIDGMIADILDDMQSNEIDYNAEFRVKWWTFTAHALSKFLQSAAVHAGTDVVRDRLLGQFDMDIDAKKPSLEDQAIRVKSDAFGSSGGADLEAQAKMAEGMGYQREVEGVQFVDSTPDLSGGYSPDIIQTVDGQPVINLSPDVDGNRFWMENNLDLAQGDESHFAQRALQLLGYESTNPLINVTSKVMQSMERTLTPAEMETVVAAFNGADGIPASVAEAALEIGRGSDLANYAENMAILTEYVESQ